MLKYDEKELLPVLDALIERWEYELVEFKEASNDYKQDEIGKYFSAISNEANLYNLQYGWLIFGVRNKDRVIVGTNYRDKKGLETLKYEISQNASEHMSFIDIFEVHPEIDGKKYRVIMFKIPAATAGIPTAWKGHFYGRAGESLIALSIEEQDRIRSQQRRDWSKQIIEGSSIKNLDKKAIILARKNFKKKNNAQLNAEMDKLNDEDFLTKLRLIEHKKLTNAAMVLLGNSEYDNLMENPPRIMWRLYNSKGDTKDYELFTLPFISVIDSVFSKIRNLTYRYMPDATTLFPEETQQYDERIFRELLHNCIAHQDYTYGMRIYVDEFEDKIRITNAGRFLPENVLNVLNPAYTAPYYRNQLLAETMTSLNMIDTVSMGIRTIFTIQKEKYFPMPDYDTSDNGKLSVTIHGKVLNNNYAKILFQNQNFDLETIFLVDRVQKKLPLGKEAIKHLRTLKVIEGRAPYIYLSAKVADIIDKKEEYILNKGFDEDSYKKWILEYLKTYKKATRQQIQKMLAPKLPDILNDQQKATRIHNILTALKKEGKIETDTLNKRKANWVLVMQEKISNLN